MRFTSEQKSVIDIRGRNVLVSAAAGSGKTAVIVERIIERVIEDGLDINEMLVVTFTKAAAQEMKERIRNAFESRLEELLPADPVHDHLLRQLSLIYSAPINTIDAFCLDIIKNNFDVCGLDPALRIADDGELRMIRKDVMDALMERHYDNKDDDGFYSFLERFSTGKSDEDITAAIEQIYDYAVSRPNAVDFISSIKKPYMVENVGELEKSDLFGQIHILLKKKASAMADAAKRAVELTHEPGGPVFYAEALESDLDSYQGLKHSRSLEEHINMMKDVTFVSLSRKTSKDEDKELREYVKKLRNRIKGKFEDDRKKYASGTTGEIFDELKKSERDVEILSGLALEFYRDFLQAKQKKLVMDFSDVEHTALEILRDPEVSGRYRAAFKEIIIDEYQDSNRVQEEIFSTISDGNNYFCVGDVKQSIYRFRDACPELFIDKYIRYGSNMGGELLLLSKNFRSRQSVLDSTNVIFKNVMHEDVGNVEYDQNAFLNYGELYTSENKNDCTEYMLTKTDEEADLSSDETEALSVAKRINELVGSLDIEDKKSHTVRKCGYGDIVILMRALRGRDEVYMDILSQNRIPVCIDSKSGYLLAEEVRTLINFLSVIDNPRQDIPLAGTLLSVFGGFDENDLAIIKAGYRQDDLYGALKNAAEDGQVKAAAFIEKLEGYRKAVTYLSVYELISLIIKDHGYDLYVRAGVSGSIRLNNLNMLLFRAREFEKTSYKGLFRFIRYIEYMKKYEVDMKSPSADSSDSNAVRIMSIHHSKGLEFPVVFLCGAHRKYNKRDMSDRLLIDDLLGAGMDLIQTDKRLRRRTFIKKVIAERKRLDLLGEELRIFYVAMTRAEQKLIISAIEACDKDGNGLKRSSSGVCSSVFDAESFGDLIDLVFNTDPASENFIKRTYTGFEELAALNYEKSQEAGFEKKDFIMKAGLCDTEKSRQLASDISGHYPFENEYPAPEKLSVSYIKHEAMEEAGLVISALLEEKKPCVPVFISGAEKPEKSPAFGAVRGSVYHIIFENIDFDRISSKEEAEGFVAMLVENEIISEKEAGYVKAEDLVRFGESSLAKRMKKAEREHKLFREQPFVILVNADEIDEKYSHEDKVMVQGIIDAYFEENGKIVIMDYKTDRVSGGDELVKRYRAQLDYYAKALRQLTGMPVDEEILYSVTLGEEIVIE